MSLFPSHSRCRSTPQTTVPLPQTPPWPAVSTMQRAPSTTSRLPSPTSPGCPPPSLRGRYVAVVGAKTATLHWPGLLSNPSSRAGLFLVQVRLNTKADTPSMPIPVTEVGSALLQRHEAYVRRHEVSFTCTLHDVHVLTPNTAEWFCATQSYARGRASGRRDRPGRSGCTSSRGVERECGVREGQSFTSILGSHVAVLTGLVQRFTQALLNNEITEASNKTLLHELEEARSAVSRLSAHQARTVGLDTRLSALLQENDDIQQERDSQTQRAKLAESRLAALKDRAGR